MTMDCLNSEQNENIQWITQVKCCSFYKIWRRGHSNEKNGDENLEKSRAGRHKRKMALLAGAIDFAFFVVEQLATSTVVPFAIIMEDPYGIGPNIGTKVVCAFGFDQILRTISSRPQLSH